MENHSPMSGPALEETLADCIHRTEYESLQEETIDVAKQSLIESLGVMAAGLASENVARVSSILQERTKVTDKNLLTRGLFFGTAAHALDYDDFTPAINVHQGAVLVPALSALAVDREISGREAITAYTAGYNTAAIIAENLGPQHYERGWHATGTIGTFGATAATCSVLDLTRDETRVALNIAASCPAGLKRNIGTDVKPLHAGRAVEAGLVSAHLAANSYSAGDNAISGKDGFLDRYDGAASTNSEEVQFTRVERYGVDGKKYPSCYFMHGAMEAAARLKRREGIDIDDIQRITVHASKAANDVLIYRAPETESESKFSMQHGVAVALVTERVGLSSFTTAATSNTMYRDLYDRVHLEHDPELPYSSSAAEVEIVTEDSVISSTGEAPWTMGDRPSTAELQRKFTECLDEYGTEFEPEQIYAQLSNLEHESFSTVLTTVLE